MVMNMSTTPEYPHGDATNALIEKETAFRPHDIKWTDETVSHLWAYYGTNPAYKNSYFALHSGQRVIKEAARHLPPQGLIVDLGCGPGHMLEHLVKYRGWAEYVGIDSSLDSLVELRLKTDPAGRPIRAVHTAEAATVLSAGMADLVLCVEVIEHCDDTALRSVLACARRLLKPGGYLFVTTPNSENLNSSMLMCPECGCRFHHWQHVRSWTPSMLSQTIKACGLDLVQVYTCDFSSDNMGFRWRDRFRHLIRWKGKGRYSQLHLPHLVAVAKRMEGDDLPSR
jgi:2-polyprenyl-3-methyl-5-hydroxy-6-metoxy-1,4-benzoquinol methylase